MGDRPICGTGGRTKMKRQSGGEEGNRVWKRIRRCREKFNSNDEEDDGGVPLNQVVERNPLVPLVERGHQRVFC